MKKDDVRVRKVRLTDKVLPGASEVTKVFPDGSSYEFVRSVTNERAYRLGWRERKHPERFLEATKGAKDEATKALRTKATEILKKALVLEHEIPCDDARARALHEEGFDVAGWPPKAETAAKKKEG